MNDLSDLLDATRQSAARPGSGWPAPPRTGRPAGSACTTPTPDRSAKGRLGKPVEFGDKAQVCDNADGIVLDHDVQPGNPADAPAAETGRGTGEEAHPTDTADRGRRPRLRRSRVDDDLHDLGVRNVVIPRKGRPTKARQAHERRRSFRQNMKWRTGCEGRISHLKRNYGWDRTMIDTTEGARTWTGHGVFAHNLTKIATLTG